MIRTSIGLNSAGKISAAFRRQYPMFFSLKTAQPCPRSIAFAADVKFHDVRYRVNCKATLGNFVSQKLKFLAKLENFSCSLCQFRRLFIIDLNIFHFFQLVTAHFERADGEYAGRTPQGVAKRQQTALPQNAAVRVFRGRLAPSLS